MAKSLRSKSKLKAKSVKRGKEFQKVVDERTLRLNSRLQDNLIKQKKEELEKKKEAGEEVAEPEEDIKIDGDADGEEKTVSTSGYRTARHHLYKKNKKKKNASTNYSKKK